MVYSSDRWQRIETLFHKALSWGPDEREQLLHRECGEDHMLLAEVSRLLKGHEDSGDFLEPPQDALISRESEDGFGGAFHRRIGSFEIVRPIATGGMGTVYEAIQSEPRRTVALKVLRLGCAGSGLRRFQHEARLLGRLRHPNIAQVFEAGTHRDDSGQYPYFAMEYVSDARSIIEFANESALDIRGRLALFATVCDAVQHGHQHGVIHRDLKPANVLIDGEGRAKVIDFGGARVVDADSAMTAPVTQTGQFLGTLVYMSPEQCGAGGEVDTRSDVYSLGVVLYELLCDVLPYDVRGRSMPEAVRMIQLAAPRRPSQILPALQGDLETIILKALNKDRDERYSSAAEFAADIRRYMSDRPIQAKPAGFWHAIRLFARRNRAGVAAAAIVLAILFTSVVISGSFAYQATVAARGEATARVRAERTAKYLREMIASASPFQDGQQVTVVDMLRRASLRMEHDLADNPEAEADVRLAIGNTYGGFWHWEESLPHLNRALTLFQSQYGHDDPKVAETLSLLCRARTFTNRPTALEAGREAWRIRRKLFGERHPLTAESMCNLAYAHWGVLQPPDFETAERLYLEALSIFEESAPEGARDRARTLFSLGSMYSLLSRMDEARDLLEQSLSLYRTLDDADGVEDVYLVRVIHGLGVAYWTEGRWEKAVRMFEESLRRTPTSMYGQREAMAHLMTGTYAHGLGQFETALTNYAKSLAIRCRMIIEKDNDAESELAAVIDRLQSGESVSADDCLTALERIRLREVMEPGNWLGFAHDVAEAAYFVRGTEAEALIRRMGEVCTTWRGATDSMTAEFENLLGDCLTQAGRLNEAETLLRRSFVMLDVSGPRGAGVNREALERFISLYQAKGDSAEAERYEEMLEALTPGPQSWMFR